MLTRNRMMGMALCVVAGALLAIPLGCSPRVDVDVGDARVDVPGWRSRSDSDRPKEMTDKRAVKIAKDRAEDEGIDDDDLDQYRVVVDKADGFWWVSFRLGRTRRRRWPDRFTIRVDAQGNTLLYKDPTRAPAR